MRSWKEIVMSDIQCSNGNQDNETITVNSFFVSKIYVPKFRTRKKITLPQKYILYTNRIPQFWSDPNQTWLK